MLRIDVGIFNSIGKLSPNVVSSPHSENLDLLPSRLTSTWYPLNLQRRSIWARVWHFNLLTPGVPNSSQKRYAKFKLIPVDRSGQRWVSQICRSSVHWFRLIFYQSSNIDCTHMKKKAGADERDATFALIFFLAILVNVSLPVLFYFLQLFGIKLCWKEYPLTKNWLRGRVFLRRFRDPIRVPRISNRVPRIRENYHRVPKIRKNRVPRIREIGSLQIQIGFLTFSLKKTA